MKVSELITHLSNLKEEHGDLEVYTRVGYDYLYCTDRPRIVHLDNARADREWFKYRGKDRKGEKVISI